MGFGNKNIVALFLVGALSLTLAFGFFASGAKAQVVDFNSLLLQIQELQKKVLLLQIQILQQKVLQLQKEIEELTKSNWSLDTLSYTPSNQTLHITGSCELPIVYLDGKPYPADALAVYLYAYGGSETTDDFYYPDITSNVSSPALPCTDGRYDITVPLKDLLSESWGEPGPFATMFPPDHDYGTQFAIEVEPIRFNSDFTNVAEEIGGEFGAQFITAEK